MEAKVKTVGVVVTDDGTHESFVLEGTPGDHKWVPDSSVDVEAMTFAQLDTEPSAEVVAALDAAMEDIYEAV